MAFCSKCGAQIGEEDKFCPSCGAMVGMTGCSDSGADVYKRQIFYNFDQASLAVGASNAAHLQRQV